MHDPTHPGGRDPQPDRVFPLRPRGRALARELERQRDHLTILDFVPLYFTHVDREQTLAALRSAANGRTEWDRHDPAAAGATIVGASLRPSRPARRLLREFLDAIEAEWRLFYGEYWHEAIADRERQIEEIQTAWNGTFAPALKPFLRKRALDDGILSVAPALGFEGRITSQGEGRPAVAAVSLLEAPGPARFSALLLVRELCFLAMDRTEGSLSERSRSVSVPRETSRCVVGRS